MNIVIIIPTYNERENIIQLIPIIYKIFRKTDANWSILIVDDNSPDGTWQIVEELQQKYKSLYLLRRSEKKGLGSAYRAGFKYALETMNIDIIFEMDADLSHNPQLLPSFLASISFCNRMNSSVAPIANSPG